MSDLGDFASYGGGDDPDDADEGRDDAETADAETDPSGESTDSTADADQSTADFETPDLEPTGEDSGLGTLAVSEGLKVSEDGRETSLRAYVTATNRPSVRLGTYLLAPYPDGERLFCRIEGLEYDQAYESDDATEIHARRAMRSDGIDERDYKFIADLDPLAVVYAEGDDLQRRMPDRVPKPETVVRLATDTQEIKTGLKIPAEGVFLGHLSVGGEKVRTNAEPPTIDYRLRDDYDGGDPLVFRHTLVAGGTGSGKTHAAKNVLRQYLAEERTYPVAAGEGRNVRAGVVMFDPQDEYAQMHDDNPEATSADERAWERQGVAYGGHDDTKAFVPKVGDATYAASHHRAEQVAFTIPFSMVRRWPWLVAGGDLNDNQYDGLTYLIRRFFDDHGRDGSYEQFRSFVEDPALREELGTENGTGRIHEATYDAVKRRISAGSFGDVFDQDAPPITDLIHEFVRPGGLSVVPTYHVTDSRATSMVVLAVASLLIDEKLSNDPDHARIKDTPLVVGMDEAHNFLADADGVQARKVVGKFIEAAKQGRKERLGLFLVTQDPQDVADAVFKQINTTVVLNLGDEDAIRSVNIPANLEQKVPYMETGQMVVYSPDNSEPVEVKGLPTCLTRHGRDPT